MSQLLTYCPAWCRNDDTAVDGIAKWSGKKPPPFMGDVIRVIINNLGGAVVKGYVVKHGYLGLGVQLLTPPKWYTEQNEGNPIATVFGMEISQV